MASEQAQKVPFTWTRSPSKSFGEVGDPHGSAQRTLVSQLDSWYTTIADFQRELTTDGHISEESPQGRKA